MSKLSLRSSTRALVAAAALGSTLTACEPLPEGADEGEEAAQSDLVTKAKGRVTHWKGGKVYLCILPQLSKSMADYGAARAQVISALADSWQKEAQLTFDYSCPPTSDVPLAATLLLKPVETFNGVGGDSPVGARPGAQVNITYCAPSLPGSNCTTQKDKQGNVHVVDRNEVLRSTAMHEVGHLLGFVHEHQRTDTPADVATWCAAARPEDRKMNPVNNAFEQGGDTVGTSYDRASIMNYCRDMDGDKRVDEPWSHQVDQLSEQDKRGVRRLYGPRRPNGLYQMVGAPAVYALKSAQACQVMWTQFVALGKPAVTMVPSAESQLFLDAYYRNRLCTNYQAGVWSDGFFQVSNDPAVYHLRGQRACHVTWKQFQEADQPSPLILTSAEGKRFREAFFTGALCTDADLQ